MTFLYSCAFVLNWLCGLLGLVLLVPASVWFVLDTLDTNPPNPPNPILLSTLVLVALLALFGAWTRVWPTIKHRIRAGALLDGLCADAFPATEAELVERAIELFEQGNGKVTPVSHGWAAYLQKRSVPGPRLWTTHFTGPVEAKEVKEEEKGEEKGEEESKDGLRSGPPPRTWKAGTALVHVKKRLKQHGKTISDTPSMEWLSMGSWLASCSHSHPGTRSDNASSSPLAWLEVARVLDCETKQVTEDDEATIFSKFHSQSKEGLTRFVILTVTIKESAIVDNVIVQRFATRLDSPARLGEWMKGEFMRLAFVSRHRRTLGIVWNTPTNNQVVVTPRFHMHPHICSRLAFWQHSDVDSALPCNCFGFAEGNQRYDGYATLSDAHSGVNPDFLPFQTILPQIFCVYNTELFVPLPPLTINNPNWLLELIIKLEDFHYTRGGRTEFRVASDSSVLFLDLSIRSIASMRVYRQLLYDYGMRRAAQHPCKWRSEVGIEPLVEISVSAVFRPLSAAVV